MKRLCALVFIVTLSVASFAWAQPGGGRGSFGGPGGFGGGSLLDLARIEAVQKEIEAVDDQLKGIEKLSEEMRAARGERPQVDWRNMSESDREKAFAEMSKQREANALKANAKLAEILLPLQIERLEQISLQMRGTSALSDPKVAAKLSLTDEQKKKLEAAVTANREAMQQAFQGGNRGQEQDRNQMREKFQQLRKTADEKVLAVLTADQKAAFEKLKGAAFTMPEGAGRGPRGGDQGGRRGGDQGGRRPGNQ